MTRNFAVFALAISYLAGCQGSPQVSSTGTSTAPSRPGNSGAGASAGTGSGGGGASGGGIVLPDASVPDVTTSTVGTADANCGLQNFQLERRPAEMLLLLDRSGSMRESFVLFGPSKWIETVPAVRETVMKTAATVQWGLKLFPGPDFLECNVPDGVEVPPAIDNFTRMDTAITMTTPTGTGTPTRYVVQKAVAHLQATASINARYLVLATDGEPNCADGMTNILEDHDGAVMAVAAAAAAGFKTYVIGIATTMSDAHLTLNRMAEAGGTARAGEPKYYPVASRQDLIAAFGQITGQVSDCVFPLDKVPPSPDAVAVDVDGMRLPPDPAKMNGWAYGAANKTVEIYGATCDKIKKGGSDVKIIFGCPGLEIP